MHYPLDIPGVQVFAASHPASNQLVISERADRTTIEKLVLNLPEGCSFTFFDKAYPSPSDPGAYVSFDRFGHDFKISRGNHGWSSSSSIVTAAELIDYFWTCRQYNLGRAQDEVMWLYVPPGHSASRDPNTG